MDERIGWVRQRTTGARSDWLGWTGGLSCKHQDGRLDHHYVVQKRVSCSERIYQTFHNGLRCQLRPG